jgi:two-component system, chemotaxis family, sensor kinase CheA
MDFDNLLETFLAEAHECIVELERATLALADAADGSTLQAIYRHLHTVKGSASCVGLEALTRAAHHLEDVVGTAVSAHRGGEPALAGLLLHGLDLLTSLVQAAAVKQDTGPEDPRVTVLAKRCAIWIAAPAEASALVETTPAAVSELRERTIRVEVSRLDRAMELAGGLTIARGRLADAVSRSDLARISATLQAADALIRDLELQILELRLVPLRSSFERLRRAVHDLTQSTGKQAQLELHCDEVEVDMAVAEALRAPLTHLIRNAIDHGIESPAERIARGKRGEGSIKIAARHEGAHLVVELNDDGAGLDRDRLLSRAREMGLAADELDDDQIWELAFVSGLSTAQSVGELSGRGIGMDVVRRSIEALRGSVRLRSTAGQGVTVTIQLPLALSIIHGLAVEVGNEVYVVPVDSVIECVDLDRDRAIRSARGGLLELRGDALPYLRLAEHFTAEPREGARTNVIVVEHDGARAGIEVDGLLGEIQTVIKPIGRLFQSATGVAGSAVLGDGRIALVVDVRAVLRAASPQRIVA